MSFITEARSLRSSDKKIFDGICEQIPNKMRKALKTGIYHKLKFSTEKETDGATTPVLQKLWEGNHLLEYFKDFAEEKKTISKTQFEKILYQYGFAKSQSEFVNYDDFKYQFSNGFGNGKPKKLFYVLATAQEISVLKCFVHFLEFCLEKNRPLQYFYADKTSFDQYVKAASDILKANQHKKTNKLDLTSLTLLKDDREELEEHINNANDYLKENPEKGLPQADLEDEGDSDDTKSNNDKYIDPFQTRIERLSIDFFERKYVFKEIDKFLQKNNSGFITVRGDGGTGKSAILANTVKKYRKSDKFNCVYYFVSHGTDHDNTINFIECLYEQLDRIYDLSSLKDDYERLSTAWHSLSGTFLNKLIQTVALQTKLPLLIAVDALDEIFDNDVTKQSRDRNLLYIPERELPENIFFLISSRNKKKQVYAGKQLNLSLDKGETHQQKDIRDYIKKKSALSEVKYWTKKNKIDAKSFVEILCDKSENRFLYLFHVFQDITAFENIDALPKGIEKFYEKQYDRFFSDEKNKEIKKVVLAGILHFKPDISLYHLSALCGLETIEVDGLIENWIAIRLIDETELDDIYYLKFSHLLFYEFINEHVIELQKLENSPDLYKKLAKRLAEDIIIDDEAKRIVYNKNYQKKMQVETTKLIPEALFKSGDMVKLTACITNWTFCKEYVNLIEHGEWKIIDYIQEMYEQMSNQNYPQEQLDKIIIGFIENIVHVEDEKDAVINEAEIFRVCDRDSKFINRYRPLNDKLRKQRIRLRINNDR